MARDVGENAGLARENEDVEPLPSRQRVLVGWTVYLTGWIVWIVALFLPAGVPGFLGVLPVWLMLILGIAITWFYWMGVVAALVGPWMAGLQGWGITRYLSSVGLGMSLYFAWNAYRAHVTEQVGLFGAMLPPAPLYPGGPVLAIGSMLIVVGLWIIPRRSERYREGPGFEPIVS